MGAISVERDKNYRERRERREDTCKSRAKSVHSHDSRRMTTQRERDNE